MKNFTSDEWSMIYRSLKKELYSLRNKKINAQLNKDVELSEKLENEIKEFEKLKDKIF